jgi:hypothetical protein
MVGPITDEERSAAMMRLKAVVVGLVGASGALVALYGDAGPMGIAVALASGLVVGVALTWYISRIMR